MISTDGISSPPTVSVDPASRPKSNGERHEMEKREENMKQPQPAQQPGMAPQQQQQQPVAEASAGVLAQAAETLQKQQAAAAAAAAAAQAQYQMDQKKGPAAVAPSAGMPQGDKSVEENGSGVVADQATRKPMPGQVKAHQPLHKDNSGE